MKRMMAMLLMLVLLCTSAAAELAQREYAFGQDCPPSIRKLLVENGYADAQVLMGAAFERDEPDETIAALVIAQRGGAAELLGVQWASGTGTCRVLNYGSCGLALDTAQAVQTINEGHSPVDRRFAVRLADGSSYEFFAPFKSAWRVYRHTGADGFSVTLNGGSVTFGSETANLPVSGWLGNWHDLSAFPKTAEEARTLVRQTWERVEAAGAALVWGANLRREATSRAPSLGQYTVAMAQLLGMAEGQTDAWYRVRIGETEGWVSSPYVEFTDDRRAFSMNGSLGVHYAFTNQECSLYRTAAAQEPVRTLDANTGMQVLAETEDGWLHVLVTDGGLDTSLGAKGVYGYVRIDAVERCSPWL